MTGPAPLLQHVLADLLTACGGSGARVVDARTGALLASAGDAEGAPATAADPAVDEVAAVVRLVRDAVVLGAGAGLDDVVVSCSWSTHLLRPVMVPGFPAVVLHLRVPRAGADPAPLRRAVGSVPLHAALDAALRAAAVAPDVEPPVLQGGASGWIGRDGPVSESAFLDSTREAALPGWWDTTPESEPPPREVRPAGASPAAAWGGGPGRAAPTPPGGTPPGGTVPPGALPSGVQSSGAGSPSGGGSPPAAGFGPAGAPGGAQQTGPVPPYGAAAQTGGFRPPPTGQPPGAPARPGPPPRAGVRPSGPRPAPQEQHPGRPQFDRPQFDRPQPGPVLPPREGDDVPALATLSGGYPVVVPDPPVVDPAVVDPPVFDPLSDPLPPALAADLLAPEAGPGTPPAVAEGDGPAADRLPPDRPRTARSALRIVTERRTFPRPEPATPKPDGAPAASPAPGVADAPAPPEPGSAPAAQHPSGPVGGDVPAPSEPGGVPVARRASGPVGGDVPAPPEPGGVPVARPAAIAVPSPSRPVDAEPGPLPVAAAGGTAGAEAGDLFLTSALPHRMPASPLPVEADGTAEVVAGALPQQAWANDVATMGRVLAALRRLA